MDHAVRSQDLRLLSPAARLERLLAGPVVDAARGLLGARLVRGSGAGARLGRIVEVEAYGGAEDRASHARFGPGSRAATMYGPPGHAYVYGVYGMHLCLNVVVGPPGRAAAVLLRGVEPLAAIDAMRAARVARVVASRRADRADPAAAAARIARVPARRLARGPGNLAAAFGVAREDDGLDLLDPASDLRLEVAPAGEESPLLMATPRIGVGYAGPDWAGRPWRFVAVDAPGSDAR